MRYLAIGFAVLAAAIVAAVLYLVSCEGTSKAVDIGTFLVLSLTLVVLVCYAYDTNSIARAAKQSADAATRTVEAMRDSDSPLLYPQYDRFFIRADRNNRPTLVYRFRNFGKTVAILNRFQDISAFYRVLPESPPFTEPLTNRPEREVIIPPDDKGTEIFCAFAAATIEEFEAQSRNGLRMYVIGRVGYEDVYGRSHIKGFCFEVTPAGVGQVEIRIAGGKAYNGLQKDG